MREILRFANGAVHVDHAKQPVPRRPGFPAATLHWDAARLWGEVSKAVSMAPEIASVGVDAWGVDYALLDEGGELLANPAHYRDPRNQRAMEEALRRISREEIYRQTGVQFMAINTLYQLYAAKLETPELFERARRMVMIPDLFHYRLSGRAVCEFTAASTTQFVDPRRRAWASGLLEALGIPAELPAPMVEPGTILGDCLGRKGVRVIAPGSHDTASAVAAIGGEGAFISSGTWSLVGVELNAPVISGEAMRMNFTNEGGVDGTTRLLKNVMGLWMLQGCRKCWGSVSYEELSAAAEHAEAFRHLVDPDDGAFLNPADMTVAIDQYCLRTRQAAPDSKAAYVRCVLESLALKYRRVIGEIERLTGRTIEMIRVMGGGSKNRVLNQFTADATGRRVVAGPVEASVLGNLGVQMMAMGELGSIAELREWVERSFPVERFEARNTEIWERAAGRFEEYCGGG